MRFQSCEFPKKLGLKTSDITTLYDYAYISISTYFKPPGSCTVCKGRSKLVYSVDLHCSHISG